MNKTIRLALALSICALAACSGSVTGPRRAAPTTPAPATTPNEGTVTTPVATEDDFITPSWSGEIDVEWVEEGLPDTPHEHVCADLKEGCAGFLRARIVGYVIDGDGTDLPDEVKAAIREQANAIFNAALELEGDEDLGPMSCADILREVVKRVDLQIPYNPTRRPGRDISYGQWLKETVGAVQWGPSCYGEPQGVVR